MLRRIIIDVNPVYIFVNRIVFRVHSYKIANINQSENVKKLYYSMELWDLMNSCILFGMQDRLN